MEDNLTNVGYNTEATILQIRVAIEFAMTTAMMHALELFLNISRIFHHNQSQLVTNISSLAEQIIFCDEDFLPYDYFYDDYGEIPTAYINYQGTSWREFHSGSSCTRSNWFSCANNCLQREHVYR